MQRAVELLSNHIAVEKVSRNVESAPMYVTDQAAFLNGALLARTDLAPRALLKLLKGIEQDMGRQGRERNGPREIDLDLVAYGCLIYVFRQAGQEILRIPHPKTPERRFVLQPLADIDPSFVLPGLGKVDDLLSGTEEQANDVRWV